MKLLCLACQYRISVLPVQPNIDHYNINFIYCWLQAINLWLYSSSYLRSCLFKKITNQMRSWWVDFIDFMRHLKVNHSYKRSLLLNEVLIKLLITDLSCANTFHFMCWMATSSANFLSSYFFLESYLNYFQEQHHSQTTKLRKIVCSAAIVKR